MARKRIVSESRKKVIQDFLAEYQPKTAKELQEILKDLMADTVQSMLEAEIDDELGYSKYDYQNKETSNSRNGYYPKTITASDGEFVVDIPRDREGSFEPKVVKKAVYVAIGVKIDGTKEVLGHWVGTNESSKYWLSVLTEIRNRGVENILIISIDNLKGFSEAIQAVYPYTEIQKCIDRKRVV